MSDPIVVAEDIDRLITLDINRRGVIRALYQAARARIGSPLVLAAARALIQAISPGDVVLIATGWPDRPWITPDIGELDGPPGAALLARSLHRALGAVPIFLIEDELRPAMRAAARGAGFAILSPEQAIAAFRSPAPLHAAAVLGFPRDPVKAEAVALRLLETYRPGAVVVIEKGSANEKGVIHNARGMDTTAYMARVDELVRIARQRGIVTIGIGDGGNEVGMGLIADAVRRYVPFGALCACPCRGGLAPVQPTDYLVTASVSNWGAYGIAACLAVLRACPDALHDQETERRTLREAADAGLIDGNTGYVDPGADGLPDSVHVAVVTLLNQIVANALFPTGLASQQPAQKKQKEVKVQ
ncbi:MAG: DUF4392 domain-containing protein [Thermoflexales bacterium]|nr:DUF4392 domain-containing protein [Thermoflexales bacterium]